MENEVLLLSGIQHFAYCPRQWSMIHIEQQWNENGKTADGRILHQVAHNGPERELRKDTLIIRGLRVKSDILCITGTCDVVEFHRSEDGIPLHSDKGLWLPYPVEYKHGDEKVNNCDRLQLCAQAVCLEEMFGCAIPEGSLYYGEIHRREKVSFDTALRKELTSTVEEMHRLYKKGSTPPPVFRKECRSCSLVNECLPEIAKLNTVAGYIQKRLEDEA